MTPKDILNALTVEEKARLCTGKDFWHLHGIERLELPSIMVTDGPHGLRKQSGEGDHVGLNASVKATCFPTASGLASSWNPALIEKMGVALGKECRAENVSVLLGPGINIKRNPLGGRNFEYFSEDPLIAGDMSTAWIKGVQSQDVGTSLKHYAVNNHEHCRMTVDAVVDQRTLREIYLPAFEKAIKQSQPWTVMCAYNKINGTYAAEHQQLLDDILVKEWGFEGIVVTDWGANNDRVEGIKHGQHLEMPSSGELNTQKILDAIDSGRLSIAALDKSVLRVLELIVKSQAALNNAPVNVDLERHHTLASKVAEESCVLLKNDQLLPAQKDQNVLVIGALANNTRYQGAGSSKINPFKLEQPLAQIEAVFGTNNVRYSQGYQLNDESDQTMIEDAVAQAEQADVIFLFAGLTPKYESEGFDRQHLNLPQVQLDLIDALGDQLGKTAVILQNGAPVTLPFVDKVPAILEAYLGGQAGASAIAKILAGDVNPSGKLAETFPLSLDDVPSQPYFPGTTKQTQYREAIWVGYRYFAHTAQPVLFPFGHGLTYSEFSFSELRIMDDKLDLKAVSFDEQTRIRLQVTVTNTGDRAGAEVVQCYLGQNKPSQPRPAKELRAYQKVFLEAGQSKCVELELNYRDFAFWCEADSQWRVESDDYHIQIGASVEDIRLTTLITLKTDTPLAPQNATLSAYFTPADRQFNDQSFSALLGKPIPDATPITPYTLNSTLGDIAQTEQGKPLFNAMLSVFSKMMEGDTNDSAAEADKLMAEAMVSDMPLRNLPVFNSQSYSEEALLALLADLNS
ncbi:glycoside hydrolase family 3 C-terminal domain-containing protein [Marinomonas posidonica]|uniref:Beta-D-glucoside glucohydrolase n=1 Tax=Marinomonas posidonica (strain CECT 7376 / NCIMB 14433 / IVIA-Po-181) TaxID=491952 RepID=F6CWF6_MARPP|nr:glycoside hydrolase family 3 C-terminal domain-containing protein [Marinomonas posidonica]AEF53211.1 Beta-glucosidase [Marinomonas posidonica IVIA-Po-181]